MNRPTLIAINNFKEPIREKINKPKPKEDFWVKLDRIIHLILF